MAQRIPAALYAVFTSTKAIGFILIGCTALSLLLANTAFGSTYIQFWNYNIPWLHQLHLPHSILHLINDGGMAFFFFMAGMENKKEN